MDPQQRAGEIIARVETTVAEAASIAAELRKKGEVGLLTRMLIEVSRRALYEEWEADQRQTLAEALRRHDMFGYARRLLGRVRHDRAAERRLHGENVNDRKLRQEHALCTYKDMELPVVRRLKRALEILGEDVGLVDESDDAETLGLAGAIHKRLWEVEAKRADLESSLRHYERGFAQQGHERQNYCGINAAFVCDQLAFLEEQGARGSSRSGVLRTRAREIRQRIGDNPPDDKDSWWYATLGEALFGLEEFASARECLARFAKDRPVWELQTTATQIAALARALNYEPGSGSEALKALVGDSDMAVRDAYIGKVGLALSGGGFRASLFHIGVLAQLAEQRALRHVEVLSCVSGGSILGAHYYLKLRALLETKSDEEIDDGDYVELVRKLANEFLDGVRMDVRARLTAGVGANRRMLSTGYSRTDRAGELFEEAFFSQVRPHPAGEPAPAWRMTDLFVAPAGHEGGFSLRDENWLRRAKVPVLALNATTLNTGHNWQFTASWMGEPPSDVDEQIEASKRLRRVYYEDAPPAHREPTLGRAVAASACVPGLFPPVTLDGLYEGVGVKLVDGGVHDNQGIASLLAQDCNVVLVSDASGQIRDSDRPPHRVLGVAKRSNSVLMSRVRGAQFRELENRARSGSLRGLMVVHLRKGLPAEPRDWIGSREPYRAKDDPLAPGMGAERPDYGIHPNVQRALSELRTDLDVFSDTEAYALMAAGYAMSAVELAKVRGLSKETSKETRPGEPPLKPAKGWPFEAMLGSMKDDPGGTLATELGFGRARFFRDASRIRARYSARVPQPIARGLEALTKPANAGRGPRKAVRAVLQPVAGAVAATPSAVAAVVTKARLRARRLRAHLRRDGE